jgi:putative oxidoreductase
LNLLRIVTGFLFLAHGAQKLFGMPGSQEPVQWLSFMGFVGLLEFFGGLLVMLGAFTRPVSFILSGMMAVAYWMVHGLQNFWPIVNRGELAALYCFVFLFLWSHGGGNFSLDALLGKRRSG